MTSIKDINKLERVIKQFSMIIEQAWTKNAKKSKISKHSKQWWTEDCSHSLDNYRSSRSLENWKKFKKIVKDTKRSFFDDKIQEVANKSRGPWELMNWIKRRKLPAIKAITHDGQPCLTLNSLWNALHNTFNTALNCQVDPNIINEIEHKSSQNWFPFSKEEFKSAISKCSDASAPGPDKLTWHHLKFITKHDSCLTNIVNIANSCINLGYWPEYFKTSSTIIIPKPNKPSYDKLNDFCPIVLLNTLGKLIEKVVADRLQFTVASNNFIHPSQLDSLKFKSTSDAGIVLTHIVRSGWAKWKSTSTLVFDISQFFPSLNHKLLILILEKAGFDSRVSTFFANYLVKRRTSYTWNTFSSPMFDVNVRVGQGSALSPILYILEKWLKNLKDYLTCLL